MNACGISVDRVRIIVSTAKHHKSIAENTQICFRRVKCETFLKNLLKIMFETLSRTWKLTSCGKRKSGRRWDTQRIFFNCIRGREKVCLITATDKQAFPDRFVCVCVHDVAKGGANMFVQHFLIFPCVILWLAKERQRHAQFQFSHHHPLLAFSDPTSTFESPLLVSVEESSFAPSCFSR